MIASCSSVVSDIVSLVEKTYKLRFEDMILDIIDHTVCLHLIILDIEVMKNIIA